MKVALEKPPLAALKGVVNESLEKGTCLLTKKWTSLVRNVVLTPCTARAEFERAD